MSACNAHSQYCWAGVRSEFSELGNYAHACILKFGFLDNGIGIVSIIFYLNFSCALVWFEMPVEWFENTADFVVSGMGYSFHDNHIRQYYWQLTSSS